jgi:hypothetical protein
MSLQALKNLPADETQGLCKRCPHLQTCEVPCAPVEKFINQDGRPAYEKPAGDNLIVLHHRRREVPFSTCFSKEDGYKLELLLSDQTAYAFLGFDPSLKQTKIVYLHLIKGHSFKDLAVMFDTTVEDIRKHYNTSKERLLKALRLLDHREGLARKAENVIKKGEERTGSIPRMQRQFLLNKIFGLTPGEIGKLEGVKTSTVMGNIKNIADKMKSGDIEFLLFK